MTAPEVGQLHAPVAEVEDVALGHQVVGRGEDDAVVLVAGLVAVRGAQIGPEAFRLRPRQHRRERLVTPQLEVGRDLRVGGPAGSARRLPEALVAEEVVEVPVAVDDPAHGLAERRQVVEELLGLAQVGPGVEDEQPVAAPHHADVQVEGPVAPPEAAVADLLPARRHQISGRAIRPSRPDRRRARCGPGRPTPRRARPGSR